APRAARRRARRGAAGGTGVRGRDRRRHGGGGGGTMRIACAFDHAGFPLKPMVLETVGALGHEAIDLGTDSTDPVDYPDTARAGAGEDRGHRARVHALMADAADLRHKYLPIAEHGLVGDLHTVALIGTTGTIDWYCCPAFDAPSVFGSVLDADQGGFYALHPVG